MFFSFSFMLPFFMPLYIFLGFEVIIDESNQIVLDNSRNERIF